jgi:hypothetical protein
MTPIPEDILREARALLAEMFHVPEGSFTQRECRLISERILAERNRAQTETARRIDGLLRSLVPHEVGEYDDYNSGRRVALNQALEAIAAAFPGIAQEQEKG